MFAAVFALAVAGCSSSGGTSDSAGPVITDLTAAMLVSGDAFPQFAGGEFESDGVTTFDRADHPTPDDDDGCSAMSYRVTGESHDAGDQRGRVTLTNPDTADEYRVTTLRLGEPFDVQRFADQCMQATSELIDIEGMPPGTVSAVVRTRSGKLRGYNGLGEVRGVLITVILVPGRTESLITPGDVAQIYQAQADKLLAA
ncbi:hypothetical protein [Mycolicibacterium fallax]|uniref:Uncharacterized protein n=1 Tax=Mycolicibacterium fallax TaxID=1793 RepID=A0A1X1QVS7_MYCFA|nr:hypothetical protein [Mycolicibacterium fallax]ORU95416.1 hypothetical protein AWC04_19985 [Mycolicibacterium fallax]